MSVKASLGAAPPSAGATTAPEGGAEDAPKFSKSPRTALEDVDEGEEVEDDAAEWEGWEDEGPAVNIAVEPVSIRAELEEIEGFFVFSRDPAALA